MGIRDIPAKAATAAEAGSKFERPDNATQIKPKVPNPLEEKFRWAEQGRIVSLKTFDDPKIPERTSFEVTIEVGAEGSGKNVGRLVRRVQNINFERLAGEVPDGKDNEWLMSTISLRLIKQLMLALGMTADQIVSDTGGIQAEAFTRLFTPSGIDSPGVGEYVGFEMVQTERKESVGAPATRFYQDFNSFFPVPQE